MKPDGPYHHWDNSQTRTPWALEYIQPHAEFLSRLSVPVGDRLMAAFMNPDRLMAHLASEEDDMSSEGIVSRARGIAGTLDVWRAYSARTSTIGIPLHVALGEQLVQKALDVAGRSDLLRELLPEPAALREELLRTM